MTGPRRVCVLEDHPMMRELVRQRIEGLSGPWVVTYAGDSIEDAVLAANAESFDCIVLDLDLGTSATASDNLARLASLNAPVVVVSAAGESQQVQEAIGLGAVGYLAKQSDLAQIEEILEAAVFNRIIASVDLAGKLAVPQVAGISLTEREQRALMLRSTGMSLPAIADAMHVSEIDLDLLIASAIDRYRTAGR